MTNNPAVYWPFLFVCSFVVISSYSIKTINLDYHFRCYCPVIVWNPKVTKTNQIYKHWPVLFPVRINFRKLFGFCLFWFRLRYPVSSVDCIHIRCIVMFVCRWSKLARNRLGPIHMNHRDKHETKRRNMKYSDFDSDSEHKAHS